MFDVVGKHSKANRYTTIKGLTEGQLGAEVVKGRVVTIRYPHDTIRIAILGSRYDTRRGSSFWLRGRL